MLQSVKFLFNNWKKLVSFSLSLSLSFCLSAFGASIIRYHIVGPCTCVEMKWPIIIELRLINACDYDDWVLGFNIQIKRTNNGLFS